MKKTNLVLSAIAATAISITACGGSSEQESLSEAAVSAEVTASEESEESTTQGEEKAPLEVQIESKEIYNENGVVITVKGLSSDDFMGPEVNLLIENNSDKDLTIQTRNSSVNGYMIDLQMSCDVAAGKKANDEMSIYSSSLEASGIDTISEIEFSFHIIDGKSWDTIADSDLITITTSAYGSYEQTYDDSGNILYDNNNIKIVSKGMATDDSFMGPEFLLYIENNSDQPITVQARDTSVNGFMVNPSISADVMPGKKIVDSISFMSSELEDNQITDIESIETSFHIFYSDSWENIEDTEPLSLLN